MLHAKDWQYKGCFSVQDDEEQNEDDSSDSNSEDDDYVDEDTDQLMAELSTNDAAGAADRAATPTDEEVRRPVQSRGLCFLWAGP